MLLQISVVILTILLHAISDSFSSKMNSKGLLSATALCYMSELFTVKSPRGSLGKRSRIAHSRLKYTALRTQWPLKCSIGLQEPGCGDDSVDGGWINQPCYWPIRQSQTDELCLECRTPGRHNTNQIKSSRVIALLVGFAVVSPQRLVKASIYRMFCFLVFV